MGGHGGLNILPQKRWNVYNFDNREKVKRDEAEAAREEQLQREAERRRESNLRLAALRRNRGLPQAAAADSDSPSLPPLPPSSADTTDDPSPAADSDGGHINLFSAATGGNGGAADFAALASADGGRGAAREREAPANPNPNKKRKEEEVRTVGPDEEKYRLGYGLAGKGVAAPWYMYKPLASSSSLKERKDREGGEGSGGKKNCGKKSIEELREERRKREAKEKERERALLGIPSRKEKQSERGRRSSRWAR